MAGVLIKSAATNRTRTLLKSTFRIASRVTVSSLGSGGLGRRCGSRRQRADVPSSHLLQVFTHQALGQVGVAGADRFRDRDVLLIDELDRGPRAQAGAE